MCDPAAGVADDQAAVVAHLAAKISTPLVQCLPVSKAKEADSPTSDMPSLDDTLIGNQTVPADVHLVLPGRIPSESLVDSSNVGFADQLEDSVVTGADDFFKDAEQGETKIRPQSSNAKGEGPMMDILDAWPQADSHMPLESSLSYSPLFLPVNQPDSHSDSLRTLAPPLHGSARSCEQRDAAKPEPSNDEGDAAGALVGHLVSEIMERVVPADPHLSPSYSSSQGGPQSRNFAELEDRSCSSASGHSGEELSMRGSRNLRDVDDPQPDSCTEFVAPIKPTETAFTVHINALASEEAHGNSGHSEVSSEPFLSPSGGSKFQVPWTAATQQSRQHGSTSARQSSSSSSELSEAEDQHAFAGVQHSAPITEAERACVSQLMEELISRVVSVAEQEEPSPQASNPKSSQALPSPVLVSDVTTSQGVVSPGRSSNDSNNDTQDPQPGLQRNGAEQDHPSSSGRASQDPSGWTGSTSCDRQSKPFVGYQLPISDALERLAEAICPRLALASQEPVGDSEGGLTCGGSREAISGDSEREAGPSKGNEASPSQNIPHAVEPASNAQLDIPVALLDANLAPSSQDHMASSLPHILELEPD